MPSLSFTVIGLPAGAGSKRGVKIDMLNRRLGRLVVLSDAGRTSTGRVLWLCQCDCGNQTVVSGKLLRNGQTRSCGCYRTDRQRGSNTRHGHAKQSRKSRTYISWMSMTDRCDNKNNERYPRYGGRGIKICDRWRRFDNFLADMGERPLGTTLHRIDNDADYRPGNCKWATSKEQGRNTSRTVLSMEKAQVIRELSRSSGVTEIARRMGVSISAVGAVLYSGTWK